MVRAVGIMGKKGNDRDLDCLALVSLTIWRSRHRRGLGPLGGAEVRCPDRDEAWCPEKCSGYQEQEPMATIQIDGHEFLGYTESLSWSKSLWSSGMHNTLLERDHPFSGNISVLVRSAR